MRNKATTINVQPAPLANRARVINIALWVLQVMLAFPLAGGGWLKVNGAPEMVEMFATIGAGQWFRVLVGALEIAGAIGLLFPRIAGMSALGLSCVLAGAITTNLFILDAAPWMPLCLLLMAALVAWGRWSHVRAVFNRRPVLQN